MGNLVFEKKRTEKPYSCPALDPFHKYEIKVWKFRTIKGDDCQQ